MLSCNPMPCTTSVGLANKSPNILWAVNVLQERVLQERVLS